MKYTIKSIQNIENPKYLFFWGHQPSKTGVISKSCLSQWWKVNFNINEITYTSAEHFMMAEKARLFKDEATLKKILGCKSPAEAKKLGRQIMNFNADLWDNKKYEIVKKANFHKFNQNEDLKTFLIKSKQRIIVEASPVDKIWGIGMSADDKNVNNPEKWKGLNLLGFALMEVRDELNKEK